MALPLCEWAGHTRSHVFSPLHQIARSAHAVSACHSRVAVCIIQRSHETKKLMDYTLRMSRYSLWSTWKSLRLVLPPANRMSSPPYDTNISLQCSMREEAGGEGNTSTRYKNQCLEVSKIGAPTSHSQQQTAKKIQAFRWIADGCRGKRLSHDESMNRRKHAGADGP